MKAMKSIMGKLLIMALIITQLAASVVGKAAPMNTETTEIVNLMTNDMINPLGIDAVPRFSWQMRSSEIGQCQSAYRISVASDKKFKSIVWDSGMIESGLSVGIEYEGPKLDSSTRYYWHITVWDKDGNQVESEAAWFETGLLGSTEEAWSGSSWITAPANTKEQPEIPDVVHYTAEGEFTVTNQAAGFVFNYIDDADLMMWQINSNNTSSSGGGEANKVFIRPHKRSGGKFTAFDDNHKIDITELVGGVDGISKTPAHILVDVTKTEIKTYVNGNLVDTILFSEIGAPSAYCGKIGVRSNGKESGTVRNMKLIDYADSPEGKLICNYDFSAENPFGKGNVVDGAFVIANVDICVSGNLKTDVPVFRKGFDLQKPIKSARIYVTGQGVFDLWINGQRIGERKDDGTVVYDELKPGFTHTKTRVNSLAYDITDVLESGGNSISAIVTPGWWSGGIIGKTQTLAFRAKMLITFEDGESETIGTDGTWKYSYASNVILADIYAGETVDGNISTLWKEKDFDDSEWKLVNLSNSSLQITALTGSRVRVREDLERQPQSINVYDGVTGGSSTQYGKINITGTYDDDDVFTIKPGEKAVVDFGQNFAGWPEIQAEGEKNTVITIRHGEMLNDNNGIISRGNDGPEGSVYTANLRTARAVGQYIMNGIGVETYHSAYSFYGFRYAEISATAEIKVHKVRGLVVTSVGTDTGTLKTSDPAVNQLISNIRWGMYSNYLSVPTDCPQRDERLGWTADTQVFAVTGAYNAFTKGFFTKWMTDVRDSANEKGGVFTDTAPLAQSTRTGNVGWADAGIIVPYNMYKMYGDKSFITENWDAMTNYMNFLETNGGPEAHWGDWLAPEGNDDEFRKVLCVAYYAWDAQMMADMARVLGKTEDAEKYDALYEKEKEIFIETYVNENGTLKYTKQTACLVALKMDLLPDDNSREKVKQQLLKNISGKGNRLQTGFLGTSIIMQTLSEIGSSDMAYKLLLQHDNPSWLYTVDQGATTCWERWDSYTKNKGFGRVDMNSFNHYAYGAVGEWMYSYMAGIMYDFDNPGFKHIILKPTFGEGIEYVDCSYDSAYGKIKSSWTRSNQMYTYSAEIPANTTATVYLPLNDGFTLLADGKQPSELNLEADGIEYIETIVENDIDYAVFNMAGNSSHLFTNDYSVGETYKIADVHNMNGGKIAVEIQYCGSESIPEAAVLIAAKYADNDSLISMETHPVQGSETVMLNDIYDSDDTIRLFIWNNIEEMNPLAESRTHNYKKPN